MLFSIALIMTKANVITPKNTKMLAMITYASITIAASSVIREIVFVKYTKPF